MNIKVSDYIADFISLQGIKDVFLISGGGNMHLIDSVGKNKKLQYYCTHHEQSLVMAAEAYARIVGDIGVVIVTTGPAGTNAITGVAGAWLDSTPLLIISGQVKMNNMINQPHLRQFGVQELPIVDIVKPITKYAVCITKPDKIRYHLEKALYMAQTGRPGPVWIDVPVDVQGALMKPQVNYLMGTIAKPTIEKAGVATGGGPNKRAEQRAFVGTRERRNLLKSKVLQQILTHLKHSKRPLLYIGHGIRIAKADKQLRQLVETLGIPVVSGWNGNDLIETNHPLYMGRPGSFGQRHANFIIQNCDFLLSIGARLTVPQMGYEFNLFAPRAYKIVVDIDKNELNKPSLKKVQIKIQADAKDFIEELLTQIKRNNELITPEQVARPEGVPINAQRREHLLGRGSDRIWKHSSDKARLNWLAFCNKLITTYPIVLPAFKTQKKYVNSYYFVDVLSDLLDKNDIIITDMGTSFTCTAQAFKVKRGQRFFTSSGLASMGFGLPGAIGACIANNKKRTICITGDGGLQMNIQELQTVIHYKLPIKIFVLNNAGYLTIRETQHNFFNSRFVGSSKESGVSCPDSIKIGRAYGFKTFLINNQINLKKKIKRALDAAGPVICEIILDPNQSLIPKVTSVMNKKGQMISQPLEDMYPFLTRRKIIAIKRESISIGHQ